MNVSTEVSANRTDGDRRPRFMYTNTATNMQTLDNDTTKSKRIVIQLEINAGHTLYTVNCHL